MADQKLPEPVAPPDDARDASPDTTLVPHPYLPGTACGRSRRHARSRTPPSTPHFPVSHLAVAIVGIDVGGTFTDAVLLDGGELRTAKIPTVRAQEHSVVKAAAAVGARDLERFTH